MAKSAFLCLPSEVRNSIYEELLLTPKTYDPETFMIYTSILGTCRQIYREASSILYQTQEHVAYIDITTSMNSISLWKRNYFYPPGEHKDFPQGLRKMTKICFYIRFEIPIYDPVTRSPFDAGDRLPLEDDDGCSISYSPFFESFCYSISLYHHLKNIRVVWQATQEGRRIWPGPQQYMMECMSVIQRVREVEFVGRAYDVELMEQVKVLMKGNTGVTAGAGDWKAICSKIIALK
ncbi:hypothetical protein MMC06_001969 [Schaereria dolodes]|nr:hypothetical protein [Schaereria dolodes]